MMAADSLFNGVWVTNFEWVTKHTEQSKVCVDEELAVWDAGAVMGRKAWDRKMSLIVFVHTVYVTFNK
ncbi:hypothetical protein HanIR_Chr09g0405671 [Helianthus annuus]|nr:hypothetical protein HanIR_Chr09g0405671 [Helianthus annuus]